MATSVGRSSVWTGRVLSAIPVLLMVTSAGFKLAGALTHDPAFLANWTASGYPPGALLPIGIVELACAVIYAVPRTAVLGAVLVTGYLGGAVATHVRMSQGIWVAPFFVGVIAWLGLYLRDLRIRALLPLRGAPEAPGAARGGPGFGEPAPAGRRTREG